MSMSFRRTVPAAAAVAAIALGGVASPAMARHGADDPAGDDHRRGRGTDDGPNHT